MRHTPGPWDKVKHTVDHTYLGTKEKPIAEICPLYGAESEANLRLIAAAPEILEALRGIVENCCINCGDNCDLLKEGRAAIDKAKGE